MMITVVDHNPEEAEPATRTPPQPHSAEDLFVWFVLPYLVLPVDRFFCFFETHTLFVGTIPPGPEDSLFLCYYTE
jgi:hypothetical protein